MYFFLKLKYISYFKFRCIFYFTRKCVFYQKIEYTFNPKFKDVSYFKFKCIFWLKLKCILQNELLFNNVHLINDCYMLHLHQIISFQDYALVWMYVSLYVHMHVDARVSVCECVFACTQFNKNVKMPIDLYVYMYVTKMPLECIWILLLCIFLISPKFFFKTVTHRNVKPK